MKENERGVTGILLSISFQVCFSPDKRELSLRCPVDPRGVTAFVECVHDDEQPEPRMQPKVVP